ncbi:tetratricopeptide repeat protein [Bdellovibrionota bacterium]
MESTRAIIVSNIIFSFILFGCAAPPQIQTRGPGDAITTEGELPSVAAVDEIPQYEGIEDDAPLEIPDTVSPRRKASLELTNKGKTALVQNNLSLASAHLEKAISIDSQNPLPFYYLALLQYRQGNFHDALGHVEQAKNRFYDPKWASESYIMAGRIREELRQWDKAALEYQKAIEINPDRQVAQEGLSRVQRRIASLDSISPQTENEESSDQEPTEESTGIKRRSIFQ